MAREKCGRHRCRHTVGRPWRHTCPMRLPDQLDMLIQRPWRVHYSQLVTCEVQTCLLFFPTRNIAVCILCTDFVMAMHVLLFKNIKGVFPIEGFRLEVYLREFTRHSVILVLFRVFLCSLKGRWYERLTHKRTFFRWFREVRICPLVEWPLASAYHVCRCGELYMRKICILTMIKGYNIWNQATMFNVWICATG